MNRVNQDEYDKWYKDTYYEPYQNKVDQMINAVALGVPEAGLLVKGAGALLRTGTEYLFDDYTRTSRYKPGVWYGVNDSEKRPPSTKAVQDPRWTVKDRTIDKNNAITPNKKTIPMTDLYDPGNEEGFDKNRMSVANPSILYYNDHRKSYLDHPSSKKLPNAAVPYSTEGFTRKLR